MAPLPPLPPLPPQPPMPPVPPVAVPPVAAPPVAVPPIVVPPILLGGPGDVQDSLSKTVNDACISRLGELRLFEGKRTYIAPTAPGSSGRAVEVQTNMFGIDVMKEFTVYHYMVHAKSDLAVNKEVVFTKKAKEDFVVLDRYEKCCAIFFEAVKKYKDVFKTEQGNNLIYDGQSILFTTQPLFPIGQKKGVAFEMNGAEMTHPDLQSLPSIHMEVYPSKIGALKISSEILGRRTADSNIQANNRAYTQFLELAFNQNCIKHPQRFACFEHGKVYFLHPENEGFKRHDCIDVGDGKSLLPGLKKTVQFIEGPYGRGQNNPCVVIDAMKAAFHKEQLVIEKIYEIIQKDPASGLNDFEKDRALQVIRGLDVFSTYAGRTRHYKLEGIYKDSAMKAKFEMKDGTTKTVVEYYKDRYNIDLKYPNANLLICKERGNQNFYPSELMTISKNQRVSIRQQTAAQSHKTTTECAVLPDIRQRLIMAGKEAMGLNETNSLLVDIGVKIYPQPLLVKGRELDGRELQYNSNRLVKSESGKWRPPPSHYAKPAAMPDIWAMYCIGTAASRFTEDDLKNFMRGFVEVCEKRGMRIGQPAENKLVNVDHVEEQLERAILGRCKFIFLITDDTITHVHARAKYIERCHSVIIQDMKMSKASAVVRQNKRLTLENVVNKTNVKLGGLNYLVVDSTKCLTDDQLLVGVGISAPPPGSKFMMEGKGYLSPQVIGFASNAISTHEFSGDFVLAPSGQEALPSIEDVMRRSINLYEEKRKTIPKRIVVYRSGASDGCHGSILAFEIPLARGIIEQHAPGAKLIYIVVNKDHTSRFFKEDIAPGTRATDMNIPAGIVVDSGITNPACKQFYLNSHTTLQGSARTPLYTVLHDDFEAPMERLEELTYTLCFHHQIVSLTTSLPTPLYVANEYAKRGRSLWAEKTNNQPESMEGSTSESMRLAELTEELAYQNSATLGDRRVNA